MGKGAAAKCATRRVRMAITNYELRITSLKRKINILAFLYLFCASAGNSFGQDFVVTQTQIDWIAEEIFLKRKIQSGDNEQKRDALLQIRNLKTEPASRIAIPALRDKSEIVRATAAFSVIFLPKDEASNVLIPLLNDKKELVRREAAYALGKVRNPSVINPLLQILQNDKILDVRAASVVALGEIGDVSAVAELAKILQRKPKDEEEFLRRSAARSIGQIAQIIQTQETEVLTPENYLPDRFNSFKKLKYPNLIEIFTEFHMANDILIKTLQNPREFDDVKREAAFALGSIRDESSIPVLQANLNSKDYYLAEISKEALEKIQFAKNARNSKKLEGNL
ncbi:MAG: HEAT repeat domain-containing protein [Acidobacteria bacterium]|nr:HEAT repeat domain-containing protein [Acidobacteriota bacterium]MCA1637120.1 HEAT repeat domain-containing protein [Acidobacteriota bacterium]